MADLTPPKTTPDASITPALYAVELRTAQFDALRAWYRDVLGLRVTLRVEEDRFALLSMGSCQLSLIERTDAAPPSGNMNLAFELEEIDRFCEQLVARGIDVQSPRTVREGYRETVLFDPDGNKVRIFAWPAK